LLEEAKASGLVEVVAVWVECVLPIFPGCFLFCE